MHHMMWEEHRVVLIVPTHQNVSHTPKNNTAEVMVSKFAISTAYQALLG